jgi:hypothetical protein
MIPVTMLLCGYRKGVSVMALVFILLAADGLALIGIPATMLLRGYRKRI